MSRTNRPTLALALAASPLRILAPVPGRPYVGVEVPNSASTMVTLRSVLEAEAFRRVAAKGGLPIALGRDTSGHPVAALRLKKAIQRGAKMIVADPRRIPLANMADIYLPIRVGSDVPLILAMCHVIEREGLVDAEFIANRTKDSEAFFAHVRKFTPEWASGICGVPAADIERAAIWYASAEKAAVYYTLGITEHVCGVDNVQSLCNLVMMTGNFGKEGCGLNPMRGQNNVQGSGDNGAVPANFPGFQSVEDVHVGRHVIVELKAQDAKAAEKEARAMCQKLLANPVTEDFEIAEVRAS